MAKNTAQIYKMTQVLLGKQSIKEYSGLRLYVDKVKDYIFRRFNVEYYKKKTRIVEEVKHLMRRFLNYFRFDFSRRGVVLLEKTIPGYFRLNLDDSRDIFIRFVESNWNNDEELTRIFPAIETREMWKEKVESLKVQSAIKMRSQIAFQNEREMLEEFVQEVVKKVTQFEFKNELCQLERINNAVVKVR